MVIYPGILLKIIEEISAHGETVKDYPGQKELRTIYRLTHAYNSPDCLKNHPGWENELRKSIQDFEKENK